MSSPVVSVAELRDPINLAIAVIVDRIRSLPQPDREDLFELTKALVCAQSEEEFESASRAMAEILDQSGSGVQVVPSEEPTEELRTWMGHIGGRIRELRVQAGLTQSQLAEKSGLPQSHISRLEQARHSPSAMTIEKLANALGVPPQHLTPSA